MIHTLLLATALLTQDLPADLTPPSKPKPPMVMIASYQLTRVVLYEEYVIVKHHMGGEYQRLVKREYQFYLDGEKIETSKTTQRPFRYNGEWWFIFDVAGQPVVARTRTFEQKFKIVSK